MRPFTYRGLPLLVLISGFASLAMAQAPTDPANGPMSEGVLSQGGSEQGISTGNKGLDALLDARVNAPPVVAPQTPSGASSSAVSAGALLPTPVDGVPAEASSKSFREAMMREAAAFASDNGRVVDGSAQKRVEANLKAQSHATARVSSTADEDIDAIRAAGGGGFTKDLLHALREYRYAILGLAMAVVALVWVVSSRSRGRGA